MLTQSFSKFCFPIAWISCKFLFTYSIVFHLILCNLYPIAIHSSLRLYPSHKLIRSDPIAHPIYDSRPDDSHIFVAKTASGRLYRYSLSHSLVTSLIWHLDRGGPNIKQTSIVANKKRMPAFQTSPSSLLFSTSFDLTSSIDALLVAFSMGLLLLHCLNHCVNQLILPSPTRSAGRQ